jgi:nucleoside 2-deoxyribosyltransferase
MKLSNDTKVFCSYAYTGEDESVVRRRMRTVVDTFSAIGILAFCDLDDPAVKPLTDPKEILTHDLSVLKNKDVVFIVMTSERRSEGMLIEIGAAFAAGKPLILARHTSAVGKTYLDTLAAYTFDWTSEAELLAGIRKLV